MQIMMDFGMPSIAAVQMELLVRKDLPEHKGLMEHLVHKGQLVLPDLLDHWDSQVQQGQLVQLERRDLQVRKAHQVRAADSTAGM